MAHDLVIRGGKVYDGSGQAPTVGDVAIDGDTISAVGTVEDNGAVEIDAQGLDVTPGFVDLHTHLDAQIGWDPLMTPSTHHGVTTALLGNCGVTFAPCKPDDRSTLAEWMESVEDIPATAILGGLPWTWEGYGGYLDALDTLKPAVNATGLVGHSAVRLYVMGDRAIDDQPTAAEIAEMADIVGQSVAEGAVGFSTSRLHGHKVPDGRNTPGTYAEMPEINAIAAAISEAGGGLFQNVLNITDFPTEFAMLRQQAAHDGVRVLFSSGTGMNPSSGAIMRAEIESMVNEGLDVTAISIPRGSGFVVGLYNNLPFRGGAWSELRALDFDARVAAIREPQMRDRLLVEGEAVYFTNRMFPMGDGPSPRYDGTADESLGSLAEAAGESAQQTFLAMADATNGHALLTMRIFNPNLEALEELLASDYVLPSLGDAGAHVGQIMDAGWTSFVLSHWVRERQLYSPEEGIRRLTSEPARVLGLADRGSVKVGMKADVNVLSLDNVAEQHPTFVHDFPGGHGRFMQKSIGYRATICNGTVITDNGEHTGDRAGVVLRSR